MSLGGRTKRRESLGSFDVGFNPRESWADSSSFPVMTKLPDLHRNTEDLVSVVKTRHSKTRAMPEMKVFNIREKNPPLQHSTSLLVPRASGHWRSSAATKGQAPVGLSGHSGINLWGLGFF